jgi:Undecaprenyl-phosphate galactose phosphotransferase WbaP
MTLSGNTPRQNVAKRQIPRRLGVVILLYDLAALLLAFATTKYLSGLLVSLSHTLDWEAEFHHFDTRRYYYYFLCFFVLLRFAFKGHYSRRVPLLAQVETILKTIGIAALFDCFNVYFLGYRSLPVMLICNWALCVALLVLGRQISIFIISRARDWKLPIALVGDARVVTDTFYAFDNDRHTGYDIRVVLLTGDEPLDMEVLPKYAASADIRRDDGHIDDFIRQNRQYYYIFGMGELRGPDEDKLTSALDGAQVEYGVIPSTKSLDVYGMEPHYFFGNDIMILHRRDSIRSPSGRIVKRGIDVLVSGLGLIPLGLLMAVVWISKKLEGSDTPVFYGGERDGMNGELFRCWKFCTMKNDGDAILADLLARDEEARAEWDKFQKLKKDPRIDTRLSGLLRKTSLDELPQIWNVFHGDMSLVGPRPILPSQREEYGGLLEQYYAVRPGLTGLWQVSGRNETSFQQRVYWDSWYIRNWSLWYDIVILFKTAKVLVTGKGAY